MVLHVKVEEKEVELSALLRVMEAVRDDLSLRNIAQYLSSKVSKFEYDSPREVVGNKVFDYEGEFGEEFLGLLGTEINSVNENIVFFGKENAKEYLSNNPKEAAEGTIRNKYGISIDKNSVHGSDSVENAKIEIDIFFKD